MKCPCYNCICVPICRHKTFGNLYLNCSLLSKYISSSDRDVADDKSSWARKYIWDILKPDKWIVDDKGNVIVELEYRYGK